MEKLFKIYWKSRSNKQTKKHPEDPEWLQRSGNRNQWTALPGWYSGLNWPQSFSLCSCLIHCAPGSVPGDSIVSLAPAIGFGERRNSLPRLCIALGVFTKRRGVKARCREQWLLYKGCIIKELFLTPGKAKAHGLWRSVVSKSQSFWEYELGSFTLLRTIPLLPLPPPCQCLPSVPWLSLHPFI